MYNHVYTYIYMYCMQMISHKPMMTNHGNNNTLLLVKSRVPELTELPVGAAPVLERHSLQRYLGQEGLRWSKVN